MASHQEHQPFYVNREAALTIGKAAGGVALSLVGAAIFAEQLVPPVHFNVLQTLSGFVMDAVGVIITATTAHER